MSENIEKTDNTTQTNRIIEEVSRAIGFLNETKHMSAALYMIAGIHYDDGGSVFHNVRMDKHGDYIDAQVNINGVKAVAPVSVACMSTFEWKLGKNVSRFVSRHGTKDVKFRITGTYIDVDGFVKNTLNDVFVAFDFDSFRVKVQGCLDAMFDADNDMYREDICEEKHYASAWNGDVMTAAVYRYSGCPTGCINVWRIAD